MIHLGYLGFDENDETTFIPNDEVRKELESVVELKWNKDVKPVLDQIKEKSIRSL